MGNVIIGQSGGPTAVINGSLAGAIKCAKVMGVDQIYGMRYGIEGFLQDEVVDMDDYIIDMTDLSLLKRTPASFLGTCRYKMPEASEHPEIYECVIENMRKRDIDKFLYIGGNDSMDTVAKLSAYAAAKNYPEKFIGIPKTIDNDLPETDHCPGYGSAAKFIASSMKEIIRDNDSYYGATARILVVEIMGRNAGWLTAASALSRGIDCKGPDLIYLPEVDFDIEIFMKRINAMAQYRDGIIVAVSEGIHLADGTMVCEMGDYAGGTDAFGHKTLSGCGKVLANRITRMTGRRTRAIEFSTLQRCATHLASRVDVDEAYNAGFMACRAAIEGQTGKMVTIQVESREPYLAAYKLADIKNIANVERKVPRDWINADGTDVTQDYINYARPLIIGSLTPYFAGGLPKHMTIDHKRR